MQGFNQGRYVPPEYEGVRSGNALHNRRAAGVPRRDGTQTVRFEMPFAVWCSTCASKANAESKAKFADGNPAAAATGGDDELVGSSGVGLIPQGVRFNATKARVGNYYSTPIWGFTIKHASCGGRLEIRTDPKNTRYVVFSGGKARDYGDENNTQDTTEGGKPILTPEERERRKEDAFAALEGKVEDKLDKSERESRVRELYAEKERDWSDPWAANRRVREGFRRERKVRAREAGKVEELQRRIGTGMEILPEREEDGRRAKLVAFGVHDGHEGGKIGTTVANGAALFKSKAPATPTPSSRAGGKKSAVESRKEVLRRQLLQNTRAVMNPFG